MPVLLRDRRARLGASKRRRSPDESNATIVDHLLAEARGKIKAGLLADAATLLTRALALRPDDPLLLHTLGLMAAARATWRRGPIISAAPRCTSRTMPTPREFRIGVGAVGPARRGGGGLSALRCTAAGRHRHAGQSRACAGAPAAKRRGHRRLRTGRGGRCCLCRCAVRLSAMPFAARAHRGRDQPLSPGLGLRPDSAATHLALGRRRVRVGSAGGCRSLLRQREVAQLDPDPDLSRGQPGHLSTLSCDLQVSMRRKRWIEMRCAAKPETSRLSRSCTSRRARRNNRTARAKWPKDRAADDEALSPAPGAPAAKIRLELSLSRFSRPCHRRISPPPSSHSMIGRASRSVWLFACRR